MWDEPLHIDYYAYGVHCQEWCFLVDWIDEHHIYGVGLNGTIDQVQVEKLTLDQCRRYLDLPVV